MIIVDASCVIESLLNTPTGGIIAERLFGGTEPLAAPALLDVEACSVLRRYWLGGQLSTERGREAIDVLQTLPIVRFLHADLIDRIWQLRANLKGYDAAYVALAEALDAPLATCDKKLAAAVGRRIHVEVF